jgi:hypothetical protein
MRMPLRLFLVLSLLGVVASSCSSVDGGVEEVAEAPFLNPEDVAELSADAVVLVCVTCETGTIYVREQLLTTETLLGEEQSMPEVMKQELSGRFDEVAFVDRAEELDILGEDLLPEDGTVIYVGPVEELKPEVIGVEVGTITAGDGFRAQMVQFQWDGDGWKLATSEDTGVTVTSSVS